MKTFVREVVLALINKNELLKSYEKELLYISYQLALTFKAGNRLYICGNGGSISDADHIAAEFIKNFMIERKDKNKDLSKNKHDVIGRLQLGLPAYSLSNGASITAIANDMDYALIFAQQIYAYCDKGDMVLALSTSGMSESVINAVKTASYLGVHTIGFTGSNRNELNTLCNYTVNIKHTETAAIQEVYMMLLHVICKAVERIVFVPKAN